MPFIGNQPALAYTSFAKQDFTTSATTSYTLDNPVTNANELALFINFVRQEPTTAYSASGTSLTLTSATSSTDDMYCVFLGKAVQTVNPPNASVGLSQLTASGTKDATTFLRGDNTFSVPAGGTNTPAFSAGLSGNQACANNANTTVAFANEIIDTNNAFNNSTYTFTVPSGEDGNYYVFAQARKDNFNTESRFLLEIVKNNSTAGEIALVLGENGGTGTSSYQVAICSKLAPLSVGDTLVCKVYHNSGSTEYIRPDGTYFGAYKIIE